MTTPKVIISAAGMCDAGRIRHHLKHNLWRPESTVVFAGYQSTGTLGRTLQDGAEKVKIFGETIEVKARIATLQGISGHADQTGLLRWIGAFSAKKPDQVFIVHGEDSVCLNYAKKVAEEYGLNVAAPFSGSVYDLAKGEWVKLTEGVPIDKDAAKAQRNDSVYVQLKTAADRLMKLVDGSSENANADIRKLTEQIQTLCDKWGG
ncbi:MAG: MBL fold metallo-hydrolase, partial [Desulfovibrio sp.]|nr:MBL fold metallo-hydrolase [Desulfovibrio sp.]